VRISSNKQCGIWAGIQATAMLGFDGGYNEFAGWWFGTFFPG